MIKPDPLTPAERALVEARVAAKDITILPMGATSFEVPVWDEQVRRLVFKGGAEHYRKGHSALLGRSPRKARVQPVPPHIVERRARVAEMHAQGLTMAQMVRAIGDVFPTTIRGDLDLLGLEPHPAVHHNAIDHAARQARVRELAAQGLTSQQIAHEMGLSVRTIRTAIQGAGVVIARTRSEKQQERRVA